MIDEINESISFIFSAWTICLTISALPWWFKIVHTPMLNSRLVGMKSTSPWRWKRLDFHLSISVYTCISPWFHIYRAHTHAHAHAFAVLCNKIISTLLPCNWIERWNFYSIIEIIYSIAVVCKMMEQKKSIHGAAESGEVGFIANIMQKPYFGGFFFRNLSRNTDDFLCCHTIHTHTHTLQSMLTW